MAVDLGKSVITQATNKVFRKVAGDINSAISSVASRPQNTSDSGKVSVELGPFNTENFQFPLDVESGIETGNHGHYIMFYINEQENAKLSISSPEEREGMGVRSIVEERDQRAIPDYIRQFVGTQYVQSARDDAQIGEQLLADLEGKNIKDISVSQIDELNRTTRFGTNYNAATGRYDRVSAYKTATVDRAPTRRLKTAIAMYMPPNVQTTYGAQYTDTEIGTFTESAFDVLDAVKARNAGEAARAVVGGMEGVEQLVLKGLLGAAGALPGLGGLSEVEAMKAGRIFTNRMELAFKGVTKRQFQYTFKMIPKSQREAEEIRKIVFAFKANMLPEFPGDSMMGRQLTVPNTFDIEYMYNGKHNSYLHHISTCFLENMTVNYGGERYTTHADAGDGAPPTETSITLNFREIETMTRERIFEGY